uniref:Fe-S cluster assembly protein SufD n=1 Tax=Candidatus Kentrum sp. FM TaxID=2126340 RepID=A0A450WQW0_9GAMM|nr:MAG: Fe-S cluster assembly protein SufD [Candidatus Kentron sp. FM]VFJ72369.1 MAG: Fe-S cluster assembly protein SufD [Candidatus Kentron sp. FM]VFK19423.1 MAG: Fe-S cluster assembly protein SufD [Candidatus Kentron sp. FM]
MTITHTTDGIIDHYRSAFSARAPHLPGAGTDWLPQRRREAFDRFSRLGFPSPDREDWKYTPIDALTEHSYRFADEQFADDGHPGDSLPERHRNTIEALYLPDTDGYCLVFIDGRHIPELSRAGKPAAGAVVGSLAENLAAPTGTPAARIPDRYLDRHLPTPVSGFAALNSALFTDGALIYLPAGTTLPEPVQLLFVSTHGEEPAISLPRILIVAEPGSAVDVVESFASLDDAIAGNAPHLTNAVTEIAVGANARVRHCKLQTEAEQTALHVATVRVHQAEDSRFLSHSVSAGARIARNDIEAVIDGEGGECTLDGLYLAGGRQHVDYHTRIEHAKPNGTSQERYKGILTGKAHGVFNGEVYVHPHAQHTDAKQRNENLLLSKNAQVDTKPQLDIFADDVQCAHGATVGQMDENMLFYLRSRGIAVDEAEKLLTYGFAGEIVHRAPVPGLETKLTHDVLTRALDSGFAGSGG